MICEHSLIDRVAIKEEESMLSKVDYSQLPTFLAILSDFKGQPEHEPEVSRYIVERLQHLTANSESGFREYLRMLEKLFINRYIKKAIEEEEAMLSQIKTS
jgi:hypothetical protein